METGEILSTDAPNELLLNALLDEDIALSIHVEGGKRSGYGMDLTITGTDGDLKVSNAAGFHNQSDNKIEGAQGKSKALIAGRFLRKKMNRTTDRAHFLSEGPLPA